MRWTAVFAIIILMGSLAGCTTIDSSSDDGPSPTTSPTETPKETPEPADSIGGSDGEIDGAELAEAHDRALRDSGSFTVTSRLTIESGDDRTTLLRETAVDLDSTVAYDYTDAYEQSVMERYTTPDATYVRTAIDDHEIYDRSEPPYDGEIEPVDGEAVIHTDAIAQLFGGEVDLTHEGTTTHDSTEVNVFEADGVEAWNPPVYDTDEVTDFAVKVLLDDNGVVRLLTYELTEEYGDEPTTISMHIEIDAVGQTSVERPEWVETVAE